MQNYVLKIKKLLNDRKIKLSELSESTGVPYRTLQDNLNVNKGLSVENLVKICTFLRVSIDELLIENNVVATPKEHYAPEPLPPDEQHLLRRFRKLDDRHKQNILEMMTAYEALSEGGAERGSAVSGSEGNSFSRKLNG